MFLAAEEIIELIKQGIIDTPEENVKGSSVDLTLHEEIRIEKENSGLCIVDPTGKSLTRKKPEMEIISLDDCFAVKPKSFVLGSTEQIFNLPPWLSAEIQLKSSIARCGLDHLNAGWIDPGFYGKITLELVNVLEHHKILLTKGMKIVQAKFFKHSSVGEKFNYRNVGQYNGQMKVEENKGSK